MKSLARAAVHTLAVGALLAISALHLAAGDHVTGVVVMVATITVLITI